MMKHKWNTDVHFVSFDRNSACKHQNHSETEISDRQMVADGRKVAKLNQGYAWAEALMQVHLKKACRFWSSLKNRFLIEKASQLTHDRCSCISFLATKDYHYFLLTNAQKFQIPAFLFSHASLWYSLYLIFIALQTANCSLRCLCPDQMQ